MKKAIYVILMLVPFAAVGKCLYFPNHTFRLFVSQCNEVIINPGGLRQSDGSYIDMQGDSSTGVLLSGQVTENLYEWKKRESNRSFEKWENDSFQSVFIVGDVSSICNGEIGFSLRLEELRPCCDTYPQPGFCFVPPTIPIVKRINDK
ncbi:MAG: hypothetical protein N0E57_19380 [Candidatus Thiodiazotropha taylori]|nr:hypothetical protein [Candidatus Thiodiazotropha taylori]